ncbi:MAG: sigma 54-interacting transcriptional regulator [Candidatus Latescibacterota bacterium]|jgi:DNA-binding NtrC family response regulator/GAF domain-containing protein
MVLTITRQGESSGEVRHLADAEIVTIGRAQRNDIVLVDPTNRVSRYHAALVALPAEGHFVRDLSSRNATKVNGKAVCRRRLVAGDVLEIGAFRLTYGPAVADEPADEDDVPLVVLPRRRRSPERPNPNALTNVPNLDLPGNQDGDSRWAEALEELLRQARAASNPQALFCAFLKPALQTVQADYGFVALFVGDQQESRCVARWLRPGERVRIDDDIAAGGYLEALRQGLRVADDKVLLVPVFKDGQAAGYICVGRRSAGSPFSEDEGSFLEEVGRRVMAQAGTSDGARPGPGAPTPVPREGVRDTSSSASVSRSAAGPTPSAPGQSAVVRGPGKADVSPGSGTAPADPGAVWPMVWIGHAAGMRRVREALAAAAASSAPILVTGETGTGKELVVAAIHQASSRQSRELIPYNCASISKDVPEVVLLGYERGTPLAQADRHGKAGLIEQADGSTLFLDEIQSLAPQGQAVLLRVLEDPAFRRITGTESRVVDVRFIAATNTNLDQQIAAGEFRADLYHRFAQRLHLPPLRDRCEDIPLLVHFFLDILADTEGTAARWVTRAAMDRLVRADWPGNIRQLRGCVETAARAGGEVLFTWDLFPEDRPGGPGTPVISDSDECQSMISQPAPAIQPVTVPASSTPGVTPTPQALPRPPVSLEEAEQAAIREALEHTRGNKIAAAKILRCAPQTLYNKIAKYGLAAGSGVAG